MIIDNKVNTLKGELSGRINVGDSLCILTGLFSIFAFKELSEHLGKLKSSKIIFTQFKGFNASDLDNISPFGNLTGTKFETRFRNQLNQHKIAEEFASWVESTEYPPLCKGGWWQGAVYFVIQPPPTTKSS